MLLILFNLILECRTTGSIIKLTITPTDGRVLATMGVPLLAFRAWMCLELFDTRDRVLHTWTSLSEAFSFAR